MVYLESEIGYLQRLAYFYELVAPVEFFELDPAELCRICNGVGPASWSKFTRWLLAKVAGEYAVVSAIHDVQQELARQSNRECAEIFVGNALKIHSARKDGKIAKIAIYLSGFLLKTFGQKYWRTPQ